MYLNNFANERHMLTIIDRVRPERRFPSTVNNACNEVGFYEIPAQEFPGGPPADHDPEAVEKFFSQLEGAANTAIGALLDGHFPPTREDRERLARFVGVQSARTSAFRKQQQRQASFVIPDLVQMNTSDDQIREELISAGRRGRPRDVRAVREQLATAAKDLELSRAELVAQLLHGAEVAYEIIRCRTWRLMRFDDDVLLTSDNPVGRWSPDPNARLGLENALMIVLPLDPRTALAFFPAGTESATWPGRTRARQINQAVIRRAHRWIIMRPGTDPLAGLEVPPVEELVQELVDTKTGPDGTVHELYRTRWAPKRPDATAGT